VRVSADCNPWAQLVGNPMGHLSFNLIFLKIKIDPNQTNKTIKTKPISKASYYEDFFVM
jgi:hypothetical protein